MVNFGFLVLAVVATQIARNRAVPIPAGQAENNQIQPIPDYNNYDTKNGPPERLDYYVTKRLGPCVALWDFRAFKNYKNCYTGTGVHGDSSGHYYKRKKQSFLDSTCFIGPFDDKKSMELHKQFFELINNPCDDPHVRFSYINRFFNKNPNSGFFNKGKTNLRLCDKGFFDPNKINDLHYLKDRIKNGENHVDDDVIHEDLFFVEAVEHGVECQKTFHKNPSLK